jgi:dienelactone hydrolase
VNDWSWLGDLEATQRRRAALWRLLGPRPSLPTAPSGNLVETSDISSARIERWSLTLNTDEVVPALLMRPNHQLPRGVVIYCHAHGNRFAVGKDELLLGRPALQSPPYGELLTTMGYAVLAIDHWCFGERSHHTERGMNKRLLWDGRTLWGYRMHDTVVALDWLDTQIELKNIPVVALGISMGSSMAVWAAALDTRITACVDMCCLADYEALLADGSFDLHAEYFFVPGLRSEFTLCEISALIAPRPHLSTVGRRDPLTPAAGVTTLDLAMSRAYAALHQPQHWQQFVDDAAHEETPAMRTRVLDFLRTQIE